jgi:SAM-dependent methyltransferase
MLRYARMIYARVRAAYGEPLSYDAGFERGLPMHRAFIERYVARHAVDIRGRCLEFQEDAYTTRFGRPGCVDILHIDDTNPQATIVADLTAPNTIETGTFDCIICTHVLHVVYDFDRMIAELHRILAPGGVLLVAVPTTLRAQSAWDELFRFTPLGLRTALTRHFGEANVSVEGFGNSLTAAGSMRGLIERDFTRAELEHYDERFVIETCGRAVRGSRAPR